MSVAFDSDVDLLVEIGFDSEPFDNPQSFTDISQYVRGFTMKRGRSNELDQFVSGTATLLLSNADNRFNPEQTTYYYDSVTQKTKIQPQKVVRISAVYNSTTYRLFFGYLTDIPVQYPAEGADSIVQFRAVDLFKTMNSTTLLANSWQAGLSGFSNAGQTTRTAYTDVEELSSDRAERLVAQAGLDISLINTYTGSYEVQQQANTSNILSALREVELSEGGSFFMNGDGTAEFRDRTYSYTNTNAVNSQATFSNNGSDLPFTDVSISFDDKEIFNVYQWTRKNGTLQEIADAESISRYSVKLNSNTTINTTDEVVLSLIQERVATTSTPIVRIDKLEINPRQDSNIWQQALGRNLGDKITVNVQNPDGSIISDDLLIESITHNVNGSNQSWKLTLTLSPSGSSAWILGFAKLGQGTRFAY